MATLTENVTRIVDALNDIKDAIIRKGQTPTGKCETFADAIDKISSGGGTDVSDTTATPSKVIENEVFYDSDGVRRIGNLTYYDGTDMFDLGIVNNADTLQQGYVIARVPERCAIQAQTDGKVYFPSGFSLGDAYEDSVLEDATFSSNYMLNRKGTITKKLRENIILEAGTTQDLDTAYYKNCTITALGAKMASGTFDSVAGQDVFVECGFEPTMIMVSSMPQYGTVATTDTSIYVKGATLEKHSFFRNTSNALTQETTANANLRFTITSNGFYYRSRFTRTNVTFMAIG